LQRGNANPQPAPDQDHSFDRPCDRDPFPVQADRNREGYEHQREPCVENSRDTPGRTAFFGHGAFGGDVRGAQRQYGQRQRPAVLGPQQHAERDQVGEGVH
jgi:hypothetical protein